MRRTALGIALLLFASSTGTFAQTLKPQKEVIGPIVETVPSSSYRTLTGKVTEIKPADGLITVEISIGAGEAKAKAKAKAKAASQLWILSTGKQTLLLRAGKNNQFSSIDLADVKMGEVVQSVVTLQADPSDRSHTAWWLVVYPIGTTPPAR